MKTWIVLAVWIAVSLSAGFIGSRFPPGEWYQGLEKPSWNPPSWVFGPVWTLLYILMGIAVWLVWKERGFSAGVYLFIAQLVLNAVWSWLFFGLNRPDLAFYEILVLWVLILATMIVFWRVRPAAGALFVPYILWVSFASVLNHTLWKLNG
ncbi:MAG TPA: tryptophan-rich sensory protein [Candidatus Sabulitectum sp.]|nr:tryptophan-rich sensory protein [Candidatus Sabulitectum sp.]HPF32674.1 tryptophan-rich sensory protein [Candidatus Sabulitectum sp.]HPJ29106.1 tryptophan-rich sensory protein [Candidatus Sabulitectum sp.]HPR22978.1 tryptophan-rich sensory protein [Candidatus Sabulitectum sp.]